MERGLYIVRLGRARGPSGAVKPNRKNATELVTSDAVLFAWPHRPSRAKLVTLVPAETIRLLLSERALDRANGAAKLTQYQLRALFEKPKRWSNLARASRRVAKWKVEELASDLGERRLLHCTQCTSREAFVARYLGSFDPVHAEYRKKRRKK